MRSLSTRGSVTPPNGSGRHEALPSIVLDEAELIAWGEAIGAEVEAPVFIGLEGPLGAGKSVLARAIGAGAGVADVMPSPSFNLRFDYAAAGGRTVVHLDLYRLGSPEQLAELGWDELGGPGQVVLVEWPERAGDRVPKDRWTIRFEVPDEGASRRNVHASAHGEPPPLPAP